MPFIPISGEHAIQEVVFVVHFDRPLLPNELDAIFAIKDSLANDLPKAERAQLFQFAIGGAGGMPLGPPPTMSAPVSIQSFKRDGSLEWRLHAAADFIAVNCLSYSRWELVYMQAKKYLSTGINALSDDKLKISSVVLQYIDAFRWSGDLDNYSVFDLIKRDSGYIPAVFSPKDFLWHVHVGQYEALNSKVKGRLLNRVHIDSIPNDDYVDAKIDAVHQFFIDDTESRCLSDFSFIESSLFNGLHEKNKITLSEILVDDLQSVIGLNERAS